MVGCAGGLSLPGPLRVCVCVCVEWIVHSVFGLLCIWRQVEALINDGQVPRLATILGPLIPPEANWGHRLRLST